MTPTEYRARSMLMNLAKRLDAHVRNPASDVRTLIAQAEQTAALARAELEAAAMPGKVGAA